MRRGVTFPPLIAPLGLVPSRRWFRGAGFAYGTIRCLRVIRINRCAGNGSLKWVAAWARGWNPGCPQPRLGGSARRVILVERTARTGKRLIDGTFETSIRPACAAGATGRRVACWLLAAAVAALALSDTVMARPSHGPAHRANATEAKQKGDTKRSAKADRKKDKKSASKDKPSNRPALADLPPDLAAVRQAFDLVRKGKYQDAIALEDKIDDPAAKKLVEWWVLRRGSASVPFSRYTAFIENHPDWPSIPLLRRRAEARLWQQRRDPATVRGFIGTEPAGVYGQLALARMQVAAGDRDGAVRNVRAAWHDGELTAETETAVLDEFSGLLTRTDHAGRMDRRIGAKDFTGAMRAAKRVGESHVAIVKACSAAEKKAKNTKSLLDAVPGEARDDAGYMLCRIKFLRHQNDVAGTTKTMLAAAGIAPERLDTDEWWRERRLLARKLLDQGDAKTAYQVVTEAAEPANPYYSSEWHFMQGWIALRFLGDVATARAHFAHIGESTIDPLDRKSVV